MRLDTAHGPVPQRVRQAAVDLFGRKGFAAVGIRELADAAGISSATLYHYVGSKDELLADLMRTALQQLVDIQRAAVAVQDTPVGKLAALMRNYVVAHALAAEQCRVVDVELRALDGQARDEVLALRHAVEAAWTDVVSEGTATGWFAPPAPTATTVRALLSVGTGVATWFRPDGPRTAEQVGSDLADVALQMVDARRGPDRSALPPGSPTCPPAPVSSGTWARSAVRRTGARHDRQ
jgi:AcrR family transcriptional regulator